MGDITAKARATRVLGPVMPLPHSCVLPPRHFLAQFKRLPCPQSPTYVPTVLSASIDYPLVFNTSRCSPLCGARHVSRFLGAQVQIGSGLVQSCLTHAKTLPSSTTVGLAVSACCRVWPGWGVSRLVCGMWNVAGGGPAMAMSHPGRIHPPSTSQPFGNWFIYTIQVQILAITIDSSRNFPRLSRGGACPIMC